MGERVLIVDDDENVLKALERMLRRDRYQLLKADSGTKALALLESNEVAAIICDYNMPDLTGADVLQKALEICPDAGRIILTGVQDLHLIMEAVNRGQVSHFVLKPWEEATLRQTVRATVERYCLTRRNKSLELKTQEQHAQLAQAHVAVTRELAIGATIYEKLLVGDTPSSTPGFLIEAAAIPSREIDGDFRTLIQPAHECLDVVTGDVMGKGLPAALVATAVKMHLLRLGDSESQRKVFNEKVAWGDTQRPIPKILEKLQDQLLEPLFDIGFFACLFYGRFDLQKRVFSYVDCGSAKPLHYCAETQSVSFLVGENLPLGAVKSDEFVQKSCSFGPGDIFLFYSDGVNEARSPSGELYGTDRLERLIKGNSQLPPKALLHIIQQSVLAHGQKETFDDDVTLVLVKLDPNYVPSKSTIKKAVFSLDLAQLDAVREFVRQVCLAIPGDEETFSSQLQLATNEAFANIVKHGSEDGCDNSEIVLTADRTANGVLIELRDKGVPFKPEEVSPPNLAGANSSGFGLFIMQEVADEVSYEAKGEEDGWNCLRIYKQYMEDTNMQFTHQRESQVLIVSLEGETLDAKEAPQFKEQITQLVAEERTDNIVFNLRDLQFIDSSGLGSFLSVLRHVNNRGGDLKLACMTKPIRTMFEVVRMHKLFEIFNTTDDAVRSFKE